MNTELEAVKGTRKAAALLIVLGDEISSGMLKYLADEEIEKISQEISVLNRVSQGMAETVLEEFHDLVLARQAISSGGLEYTRKLLEKSLGSEGSSKILERVTRSVENSVSFDALEKTDPQQLSQFIQNEHPQTIALVLAHLNPAQGAELLSSLPDDLRADIIMRMANLGEIAPEVIKRISEVLSQKLQSLGGSRREAIGGTRAVADLVNKIDRTMGAAILEKMEEENPELALAIRNLMFVFEDIINVDSTGIREILQRVDKKTLTVAMKGTNEELQNHIFGNMSSRAVEMMKEDMDALGPVRVRDVEKAQREIVEIVQKLEQDGVLSTGGGGGDDYVV